MTNDLQPSGTALSFSPIFLVSCPPEEYWVSSVEHHYCVNLHFSRQRRSSLHFSLKCLSRPNTGSWTIFPIGSYFLPFKLRKCSITYRITRHGCTIFLPLRETIEESAKRRHLWQYWAKRGAARCPECNADSSIGSRGCKQIGLQGRVWGRYRTLFTNTNNYKTLW